MASPLVFLSYCHENRDTVSEIRTHLLNSGIDVWWDQDVPPGADWKFEIRKAIQRCDVFVLCLSKESQERHKSGIYPEALDAIAAYRENRLGEIYFIPLRLSECEIPPIEIDATRTLQRLQYLDLFPPSDRTTNLESLVHSIRNRMRSTPSPRPKKGPMGDISSTALSSSAVETFPASITERELQRVVNNARDQAEQFRQSAVTGSRYNWSRLRKLALDFCGIAQHLHWGLSASQIGDDHYVEAAFVIHEFVATSEALLETAGREKKVPKTAIDHIRRAVETCRSRIKSIEEIRQEAAEMSEKIDRLAKQMGRLD